MNRNLVLVISLTGILFVSSCKNGPVEIIEPEPEMPVNITLICNPEDGGTANGEGTYDIGSRCTVKAEANMGYQFANWTEDETIVSPDLEYIFTVTKERTLIANFTSQIYTIKVGASPDGSGTVTGGGTYGQGQSCNIHAAANTGYAFLKWTENGNQVSTEPDYTFIVSSNRNLLAYFQKASYTISVSPNPSSGGTVGGGGIYNYGQSCTITAIPSTGYDFVKWTRNGTQASINPTYTFDVNSSAEFVAHFQAQPQTPIGAIDGLFSVSDNEKVYFSQGNLQYKATTNIWRFAEHQWDCQRLENENVSSSYDGWIDLFGWGTSGYEHGAVCYQPWSTSRNYDDYYAYSSYDFNLYDVTGKADWGYNAISNGGNTENQWRTLTSDEWLFLLMKRDTPSGIRYAKAIVNGIEGLVVLPDDWDTSIYRLHDTDDESVSYTTNNIMGEEWEKFLEPHGVLFLPAGSYRSDTHVEVFYNPFKGYYWSSSYSNQEKARSIEFNDTQLHVMSCSRSRNHGLSVRLVQNAKY